MAVISRPHSIEAEGRCLAVGRRITHSSGSNLASACARSEFCVGPGQHFTRCIDPRERVLGFVLLNDESLDGGDRGSRTGEHVPLYGLAALKRKPGLHPVHPAGAGRREVAGEAGILHEPRRALRVAVCAVVVQNQVDLGPGVAGSDDLQKAEELLMAVAGVGAVGDRTGGNVDGCE